MNNETASVNDWIHPDEQTNEKVAQTALAAACDALAIFDQKYDVGMDEGLRAILAAFVAIDRVKAEANDALKREHPGKSVYSCYIDEHHIAASALENCGCMNRGLSPYSRGGYRLVLFAAACKMMDCMSEVNSIVEAGPDCNLLGEGFAGELLVRMTGRRNGS